MASSLEQALRDVPGALRTEALPAWNNLLNQQDGIPRAAALFAPRDAEATVAAVAVAARLGVRVSARGSGHHYGGVAMQDGALVLDLAALNHVQVDAAARTVRVGPAATARQLMRAIAPHGLHFTLPHLPDVGLGGFILGGGNGWGVRQWGAAADNVQEVEVVLLAGGGEGANGTGSCKRLRVRADSEPDLFWGLLGAGAFLGVVTEFVLRLHPVPPTLHLMTAAYPLHLLHEVGGFFRELQADVPSSIEASLVVVCMPSAPADEAQAQPQPQQHAGCHGAQHERPQASEPAVLLCFHAFAEPGDAATTSCYDRVRGLLPKARLFLRDDPDVPYEQAMCVLEPAWHWPGLCMYGHGAFVPVASLASSGAASGGGGGGSGGGGGGGGVLDVLAAAAAAMTSPRSILLVAPAAPNPPAGAPAGCLCFRGGLFIGLYGMWTRTQAGPAADGDARHVEWVRSTAASLQPHVEGLYVNEVMHDDPGQVGRCYDGATLARLRALKQRVDPHRLLRRL